MKFYQWDNAYYVSESEPPQLLKKNKPPKEVEDGEDDAQIRHAKVKSAVPLVVVPIEDMFERCWEIHNRVGKHENK